MGQTKNKITSFLKANMFIVICFLSSLPLIALGVCGIMFLYQSQSVFQTENMYWIRPVGLITFIIIVEFVIVGLPIIVTILKNKQNKAKTNNPTSATSSQPEATK
jgi:magnesium-transporting ATPase (P-type)